MPVKCFSEMFLERPDNIELDLKNIRLKAVTVLSLFFMCRPSDLAPKSLHYDESTKSYVNNEFSTDHVVFSDTGMSVTLFGIKNDTKREGYLVKIPFHPNNKLNPVSTLQAYIHRTAGLRPSPLHPVLVSLNKPHKSISSHQIADILNQAIKLAGLSDMGFSAKLFRCSAATAAIAAGQDPDIVRKVGRWNSPEVFFNHYVHSQTPVELVQATIGI